MRARLVLFLLDLILTLSLTALVFGGRLSDRLPEMLGAMLLGNALMVAMVAVLSSQISCQNL